MEEISSFLLMFDVSLLVLLQHQFIYSTCVVILYWVNETTNANQKIFLKIGNLVTSGNYISYEVHTFLRNSMLKIIPNFHLEYFAVLQQSSDH